MSVVMFLQRFVSRVLLRKEKGLLNGLFRFLCKAGFVLVFVLGQWINSAGQAPSQKINLVFKGFSAYAYYMQHAYLEVLNERMRSDLVSLNKFNIIERDAVMWKRIEEELKIQDFIDPNTAINLGNMLGAKFYIEGKLVTLRTDKEERRSNSGTLESVSYTTTAEASLNLINLETGKYEIAVSSNKTAVSSDSKTSVEQAINALVKDLSLRLSKKFLLEAHISALHGADGIVIDKGVNDGVRPQVTFVLSTDKSVKFKIIEVSENKSTGKLMEGNEKKLSVGQAVVEAEIDGRNVVHVTKKDANIVYIDAGKNIGIKKGDTFISKEDEALDIGTKIIYEEIVTGAVYITEVNADYAKGKVIKGYKNINKGIVVYQPEKDVDHKGRYLTAGYKMGLTQNIKANTDHGVIAVQNAVSTFDVNTSYNNDFKDLKTVSVFSCGIATQNFVKEITTSLNFDFYNIGNGEMKNWISNLEVTYNHTMVPEKLFLLIGGAAGYGRLKQDLPGNAVTTISNYEASYLKAHSIYGSGIVGAQLSVKRFAFTVTASYEYLNFNKWKYDIEYDSNEETAVAPDDIVPYPKVDLGGVYVKGGVRYKIRD